MRPFYAYLVRCRDGSYYVGHTDDLEKRMAEHHQGTTGGYTSARRPVALVWSAEFGTRVEAQEAELQLKGWSRAKKEALVRGDWATLVRLSGPRSGIDRRAPFVLRQAQHERNGRSAASQPPPGQPLATGRRESAAPDAACSRSDPADA